MSDSGEIRHMLRGMTVGHMSLRRTVLRFYPTNHGRLNYLYVRAPYTVMASVRPSVIIATITGSSLYYGTV
jgi:hypothetical protein